MRPNFPYRLGTIGLGLAVVLAAGGCSTPGADQQDTSKQCGFVMDASGSAEEIIKTVATEKRLKDEVLNGGCGRVAFAVVTGASETTLCKDVHPAVDLVPADPNNKIYSQAISENRAKVAETLTKIVECGRPEQKRIPGSDVFGALKVIADKVPPDGSPRNFYIFSDMMESTPDVSFYKTDLSDPGRRNSIAKPFLRPELKPNFANAKIYYFGLGGDAASGQAARRKPFVQKFWTEYISHAGGQFLDGST